MIRNLDSGVSLRRRTYEYCRSIRANVRIWNICPNAISVHRQKPKKVTV